MVVSKPPAKGPNPETAEDSATAAPQSPSPKSPQPQQATAQQKGPGAPGAGPKGPQPPAGTTPPPQKPGPTDGPPEPPPIQMGPSPGLQDAYAFLQQYVQSQGLVPGGLPPDMLNGSDPDTGTPLNNLGQSLPSTVTGDIKTFPKYSLATGAPNSPGLPTGIMPPSPPQQTIQQAGQRLIGGIPAEQVKLNQRKIGNA